VTRDEVESTVGQRIAELPKSAASISTWTALAGALGLGGPIGLGVGVAGWLVSRRVKRKVGERLADASPLLSSVANQAATDEPSPRLVERIVERVRDRIEGFAVRVDTPPAPPERVIETRWQQVPSDLHAEAWAWAKSVQAQKFPGQVDVLDAIDSMIVQYIAGRRK
jgi:hypothetical protein